MRHRRAPVDPRSATGGFSHFPYGAKARILVCVMPASDTCWTLIEAASRGDAGARSSFAHRYLPVVRTFLGARWNGSPFLQDVEDAVQEVFLECFRRGGAMERVDRERPRGLRAYLYGVVRNVAARVEERRARVLQRDGTLHPEALEADEARASQLFDRAWARSVMRQAAEHQRQQAALGGEAALRRVELLELRFRDGLPIREIARRFGEDAAVLHREYALARKEFKRALREVVAFDHPGPPARIEEECAALGRLLDP